MWILLVEAPAWIQERISLCYNHCSTYDLRGTEGTVLLCELDYILQLKTASHPGKRGYDVPRLLRVNISELWALLLSPAKQNKTKSFSFNLTKLQQLDIYSWYRWKWMLEASWIGKTSPKRIRMKPPSFTSHWWWLWCVLYVYVL